MESQGAMRIVQERLAQIKKYPDDSGYIRAELRYVAVFVLTLDDQYYPDTWNLAFKKSIEATPLSERLIIAGAFCAAEYDRLFQI